jgi:hypothetical protein
MNRNNSNRVVGAVILVIILPPINKKSAKTPEICVIQAPD